jgi:ABC-type sugar transport system ATPase subunit
MIRRSAACSPESGMDPSPPTGPPRLRMEGVHKRFGATIALEGVSLEVASGQVHALIGENGAGKSTLMKVLSGAVRPDRGQMWLDGIPYAPRTPADGRRAGVAMIYQELSLAPHLNVMENILLGARDRGRPALAGRAAARGDRPQRSGGLPGARAG